MHAQRIPILRRSSGGAAIVAGPGCLMYAVVLSYEARPELRDISRAHAFVLDRLATCAQQLWHRSGTRRAPATSCCDRSAIAKILRQQPAGEADAISSITARCSTTSTCR